jgi:hypothetical protein
MIFRPIIAIYLLTHAFFLNNLSIKLSAVSPINFEVIFFKGNELEETWAVTQLHTALSVQFRVASLNDCLLAS